MPAGTTPAGTAPSRPARKPGLLSRLWRRLIYGAPCRFDNCAISRGHVHVESAEAGYRPVLIPGDPRSDAVAKQIRAETIARTRAALDVR